MSETAVKFKSGNMMLTNPKDGINILFRYTVNWINLRSYLRS